MLRAIDVMMVLLGLAVGCGDAKDSADAEVELVPGGPTEGTTEAGLWRLSYATDPSPIPFNDPFEATWAVEALDGAPEAAGLLVEPWMPAHGHGGATNPTTTPVEGGFVTTDLQLHMPGEWELRLRVDGDGVDDVLVLPYTCCVAY